MPITPSVRALGAEGIDDLVWADGVDPAFAADTRRIAAAHVGHGLLVQGAMGSVVACNPMAMEQLGLTWEQLIGRTSSDARWSPVSEWGMPLPAEMHPGMRTLATGESIEGFVMGIFVPHADTSTAIGAGSTRWVRISSYPVGASKGSLSVFDDVTDTPRGTLANDRLFSTYRLIAENATDAVVLVSLDWTCRWASPATRQVLGYEPSEIIGTAASHFVHPDDQEVLTQLPEPLQDRYPFEVRILNKAGDFRWMSGVSVRLHDAGGAFSERIITLRDVHEKVLAGRELSAETSRLHRVLEAARMGLWEWDITSHDVVLDERCADILGYGLDEIMPADDAIWARLVHEEDLRLEQEMAERHRQGLAPFIDIELRMRHRDGHWVWTRDRGRIVDWSPDGSPLRMAGTLEDITAQRRAADQLAAAEEQFRTAMDYSTIGLCLVSPTGQLMRVNPALCRILGRTADELQALTWQDLTHPDDLEEDLDLVRGLRDGKSESYRRLKRYLAPDGRVIWGDLSTAAVRNADGSVRLFVSQIVDVTDRITAERALEDAARLLRVVLDNSRDGIARYDTDIRFDYVNQRVVDLSGVPAATWIGRTHAELGYPKADAVFLDAHVRRVLESREPVIFDYEVANAAGRRWYESSMAPEFAPDGTVAHVISTNRDITARRQAEMELLQLATHDPLTGLANRAALLDEIARSLHAGQRTGLSTAVLLIDLDRFKLVNDSLGHSVGDELLTAAANRIEATVRGGDLVARPGGDEFAVVMRALGDPAEAVSAAWRIVNEFRLPFTTVSGELFATASIGVAISTESADPGDLVREADTAMYVAKNDGRDRVAVFNEDLRAAIVSRLEIEGDLRHALDRGELDVWYQPEIDLVDGSVIAVEALLRWHHPDGETYIAGRFIDVAEETGLILDIGDWVLKRACAQAVVWARQRPDRPLVVRVNVSAHQLVEVGLLDALDDALLTSGLDPAILCLEITETALLRETATVRVNLAGIRERGVQIAVDDFGTGYASLAYLRSFPVDVIKIDRSFVANVTTSEQSRRLVTGIVALADALGIAVTAEGVEHDAQAVILRELGCPGAQGFLYSQAVDPAQISAMLGDTFPHR